MPADRIRVSAPLTPDFPRPLAANDDEKHTSDLLRSTDQYRLKIVADPSVPILSVFAQAPTTSASDDLANAAVDGTRDYLVDVGRRQQIAAGQQVQLSQLGRATGGIINRGVRTEAMALTFVFVLSLAFAAVLFFSRTRKGWRVARERERGEAGGAQA